MLLAGLLCVIAGNVAVLHGGAGGRLAAPASGRPAANDPPCDSHMRLPGSTRSWCVHDDGLALRANPAEATAPRVPLRCATDRSANSVQVVYVHPRGQRDALVEGTARRRIDAAMAAANGVYVRSARATGGYRALRVATTGDCEPAIIDLAVPPSSLRTFRSTIAAMTAAHLTAPNRKYIAFVGPSTRGAYCGQATLDYDSQPGPMNASNIGTSYARVDCWEAVSVAHEIGHMLGAVQYDAPHGTAYGHCYDVYDVMCYQDGPGTHLEFRCPPQAADLLDCHHDDYFSTDPKPGSYLATHWNVANSSFLIGGGPPAPVRPVAPVLGNADNPRAPLLTCPD